MSDAPLLKVQDLGVTFRSSGKETMASANVCFESAKAKSSRSLANLVLESRYQP